MMNAIRLLIGLVTIAFPGGPARGQAALAPAFDDQYTIVNLGAPPGVPSDLGGICFLHDDPNILLIGGRANTTDGAIYAVPLVRDDAGHIVGFGGPGTLLATAPGPDDGGINGSLSYFDDSELLTYCTYPDNGFGQIGPGQATPNAIQDLDATILVASLGAHAVVPCGLPGGHTLKFTTHDPGSWYEGVWFVQQDAGCGVGCLIVAPTRMTARLDGGLAAITYVRGTNPAFDEHTVLITKRDAARIDGYRLDPDGNPRVDTEFPFVTNLAGAFGMTVDGATHDLVVSTSGDDGNEIHVVVGFDPCPAADLDGDCLVNASDLAALLAAWGHCAGCDGCDADLNCDCEVNSADLGVLLAAWTSGP